MKNKRNIAIIPARAGSKRIPGKNIRDFLGKPIIAYSIQAALDSSLFENVMVSTDSDTIRQIAVKYGAEVPFFRSTSNSNDQATIMQVLFEVIGQLENRGKNYDSICCIFPTAPFITAFSLQKSYNLLIDSKADAIMPVVRYSHPIERALTVNSDDQKVRMIQPKYRHTRTQDLSPKYHEAGQFFWIKSNALDVKDHLTELNTLAYELPHGVVQDIDTEEDWEIAELKYTK